MDRQARIAELEARVARLQASLGKKALVAPMRRAVASKMGHEIVLTHNYNFLDLDDVGTAAKTLTDDVERLAFLLGRNRDLALEFQPSLDARGATIRPDGNWLTLRVRIGLHYTKPMTVGDAQALDYPTKLKDILEGLGYRFVTFV